MRDHQPEIIRLALEKGWNPAKLSEAQFTFLSLQARTLSETVKDGARAVKSRVRTSLGLVVLPQKVEENRAVCLSNSCGKLRIFKKRHRNEIIDRLACDACNCKSKWLESKLADPTEACPFGLWDNRPPPPPESPGPDWQAASPPLANDTGA